MSSILVVGAAGFVGSRVCSRLMKDTESNYVCGIDDLSFGDRKNLPVGMDFMEEDIDRVDESFMNRFDIVVSSFCSNIIYAQNHPIETYRNNSIKGLRLFSKYKGKIVNLSTSSVYGNAKNIPTKETDLIETSNAYDGSKLIMELFLEERQNYTSLRLSNCYGICQRPDNIYAGVVSKMIWSAINDSPIEIIGEGHQSRDLNFVENVVDAIMLCIEQPAHNDVFNIASGEETEIVELARMILQLSENEHRKWTFIPKRSIDAVERRCLDITKAKEVLGWSPKIDLRTGLRLTMDWMKNEMPK